MLDDLYNLANDFKRMRLCIESHNNSTNDAALKKYWRREASQQWSAIQDKKAQINERMDDLFYDYELIREEDDE